MSFVSFAQNFEDVMLWRALNHVQGGFYIDVGANDPVLDSVTKAFYDHGWHGVNLEPSPRYYHDLTRQRPKDINLQQAVGDAAGSLILYEVESVRGWGTLDATMAEQYRKQGYQVVEIPVCVTTLSDICQQHVTGPIHFMKVDVEGAEELVLRGMDFSRWRPWIIIAESRVPAEQGDISAGWEQLLLGQQYRAVYFDGINTFYLADEHRDELLAAFSSPPNTLDDFVRHAEWRSGRYAEELELQIAQMQEYIRTLETRLQQFAEQELQIADLTLQRADLKRQLSEFGQLHAGLVQQHAKLQQQHAELQQQHAELQQQDADLKLHYADLKLQHADLERQLAEFGRLHAGLQQQHAGLQQQHAGLQQQYAELEGRLATVYASSSWRVTAPLRAITAWLRRVAGDR